MSLKPSATLSSIFFSLFISLARTCSSCLRGGVVSGTADSISTLRTKWRRRLSRNSVKYSGPKPETSGQMLKGYFLLHKLWMSLAFSCYSVYFSNMFSFWKIMKQNGKEYFFLHCGREYSKEGTTIRCEELYSLVQPASAHPGIYSGFILLRCSVCPCKFWFYQCGKYPSSATLWALIQP